MQRSGGSASHTLSDRILTYGRWLDTVPVGRVITRCTQDIGAIDGSMVDSVGAFMSLTTMVITPLVTAIYMTGWLAFVSGVVTMGLGGFLGRVYLVAQMSVRQQMSMAKSPVLSHVGTVLAGLRAFSYTHR